LNTTADALLTSGMMFHQPLAFKEMIAFSVGNCKCFNKFDQSGIYFRRGCAPWCTMKHFPHPCALHLRKMLRAAKKGQSVCTSIVELDMMEGKTDRLTEVEIWSGSVVLPASTSRICLLHKIQEAATRPL
jgi:hypothetical protein